METKTNKEETSCNEDVKNEIPEFTQDEIQAAIDKLEKGKASDNNGIRAEDMKTCDATTKDMVRQIFNEILKQEDCTPETWRRIRLKVIYKKKMWNRFVTTTRFALSQHCKRNLMTREGVDVLTKRWTILQRTDC